MGENISTALIIPAAGEGKRFTSGIKQLAAIDGKPLLQTVLENVITPDSYHTIVVLGAHRKDVKPVISLLPVHIAINENWQSGLSSSINIGVEAVKTCYPETQGILILLGDQWKVTREQLGILLETSLEHPEKIIATDYSGTGGVPAFFPLKFWPLLQGLEGDTGAKELIRNIPDIVLVKLPEAKIDLDTSE